MSCLVARAFGDAVEEVSAAGAAAVGRRQRKRRLFGREEGELLTYTQPP